MIKYFVVTLLLISLLIVVARTKNSKRIPEDSIPTGPQSIVVLGAFFDNLPTELAEALKSSERGKIPYYGDIEKLHTFKAKGEDNPDILLALALLQAYVVESGIYIDDLREHLDIGRKFSEDYFYILTPDIPDKFLIVADKIDNLEGQVQRFEANPPL